MRKQKALAMPMGSHESAMRGARRLSSPEPTNAVAAAWSHPRAARWPIFQVDSDRITDAMRIPAPPFGPTMPRDVSSAMTEMTDPLAMSIKAEKST